MASTLEVSGSYAISRPLSLSIYFQAGAILHYKIFLRLKGSSSPKCDLEAQYHYFLSHHFSFWRFYNEAY